jgi:hypothetical protein
MISTLAIAVVLAAPVQQHRVRHREPRWLDGQIAKRDVGHDIAAYDPSTGFMLLGGSDCDGAFRGLTLTADRYMVARERGYNVPNFEPQYGVMNGNNEMVIRKLPLVTEKGVHIGMTESALITKFGRPTKIKAAGWRKQFRVFTYTWHQISRGRMDDHSYRYGRSYTQEYTFKKKTLIEIHYGSASDMNE